MLNEKPNNNKKNNKKKRRSQKRHSAPPTSDQAKKYRYRSPFSISITTTAPENGTDGHHSDEYESPKKVHIIKFNFHEHSF